MKKVVLMPVVAAVLFAAACGGDGPPTAEDSRPMVRFANGTTGLSGNGGFTINGQFAAGSALASGQVMQTCSRIDPGQTTFGFGAANAGGTGLSGSVLASTMSGLAAGGSYTVVATGPATSATMFLFSNSFSGSLSANQAAVRFVSLAPTTGTTVYNYVFFQGGIGTTTLALNLPFGVVSTYTTVASGANTFSALQVPGFTTVDPGSTFTLQAGSVNTIALVPRESGGFQLIQLPRCA